MIGTMMVVSGLWNKPGVYTTDEFDPDPYMEALNKVGSSVEGRRKSCFSRLSLCIR